MLLVYKNSTDYSAELENYISDTVALTLLDSDYLYVGYKKPINAFYVAGYNMNTNTSVLTVEYYNGSAFTDVTNLSDKTSGLARDGFVSWDRNLTNEDATTINSLEKYWYRISVDVTTSAMTLYGLNLLLSDDLDIKELETNLVSSDYFPDGFASFLPYHQSARNEIIQRLRNEGNGVYNGVTFYDLTVFDLLDYTQLKEASKHLAISNIYFNLSDSIDDKYYQRYQEYRKRYDENYRVFYLSIDTNDDGEQSASEKESFKTGFIIRV